MGINCGICTKPCKGCELPYQPDSVKILQDYFKKITLAIEWNDNSLIAEILEHPSYQEAKQKESELSPDLSLESCFEEFSKEQVIDGKCEKCQAVNSISMKTEIWKVPDILILVLKRFTFERGVLDKIDAKVDFPLWAFDISDWSRSTGAPSGLTLSTTSLQLAFDLFTVVNHSGSLMGGHYTSFCLQNE